MEIKSQPYSKEAEEAVLGGLLIDPKQKLDLNPEDFYVIANRWIYEAFLELKERADLITLSELLSKRKQDIGKDYILSLINKTPSSMNTESYAEIVREKAIRRRYLTIASELATCAMSEKPIDEFTASLATKIVQTNRPKSQSDKINSGVSELYDQIKNRYDDPKSIYGIPTGITDYDKLTYGNHRGEMTVIAGEPGIGKTKLLMKMAYGMQEQVSGVFYSMEMKAEAILRRQLSVITKVSVYKLRSGLLDPDDWEGVVEGTAILNQANIFISDATDWTTNSLRADLARLIDEHDIGWFVLDYLGKLRDHYGKDDVERTKQISESVHNICLDLNLAGIVASSMNKEGMKGSKPGMADLSGSGQLAFNADNIIFMIEAKDMSNVIKLYWAKIRESTGLKPTVNLYAHPHRPTFEDYQPGTNHLPYKD